MHRLLIVDDEEIEREGMAQFIPWDTYGMKVVGTARNDAEGLEKIAKYKPDLAIVDIKMPVLNKAIAELEETRAQNARSEKVEAEARLLKPYAREQLFRDLLQGRALPQGSSTRQLLEELGGEERSILLLDFRLKCGFDSLERYVVGNMLGGFCRTAPCGRRAATRSCCGNWPSPLPGWRQKTTVPSSGRSCVS